uniref:Protein kinase domain-containing protein n=1 Tax=Acrobeloides nanus TaxID=290746 RepID=A0A914E0W9_9BILA
MKFFRGCFGKVYLCKEKSTQLNLAAKCIRLSRDSDRKKVEKEVAIMSKLQHRFITQLYDAFATSSRDIILVMELRRIIFTSY